MVLPTRSSLIYGRSTSYHTVGPRHLTVATRIPLVPAISALARSGCRRSHQFTWRIPQPKKRAIAKAMHGQYLTAAARNSSARSVQRSVRAVLAEYDYGRCLRRAEWASPQSSDAADSWWPGAPERRLRGEPGWIRWRDRQVSMTSLALRRPTAWLNAAVRGASSNLQTLRRKWRVTSRACQQLPVRDP